MGFDWSPHKGGTGEFVKFDQIGASVTGQVTAIRTHTFDVEKGPTILIDLDTQSGPMTLDCNKVDLKIKLAEIGPQVGDKLGVKWVGTEKVANGTKKVFEVRHKPGVRESEWDDDGGPTPTEPPTEEPF